jgi:hypothetical protein
MPLQFLNKFELSSGMIHRVKVYTDAGQRRLGKKKPPVLNWGRKVEENSIYVWMIFGVMKKISS